MEDLLSLMHIGSGHQRAKCEDDDGDSKDADDDDDGPRRKASKRGLTSTLWLKFPSFLTVISLFLSCSIQFILPIHLSG